MAEHSEWCHTVIGCTEPNHCTCDAAWPALGSDASGKDGAHE